MTSEPRFVVPGSGHTITERPIWVLKPDPGFTFSADEMAAVAKDMRDAAAAGSAFWLPAGLSLYDAREGVPRTFAPPWQDPPKLPGDRGMNMAVGCSIMAGCGVVGAALVLLLQSFGIL